jgi:hypothetical protein
MEVCLLWVLCVVRYSSLRRFDNSSRGVLPTVVRRVWSRNVEHEEAKARYRAVKIQPQWVVTPGKQTTNISLLSMLKTHLFILLTKLNNFSSIYTSAVGFSEIHSKIYFKAHCNYMKDVGYCLLCHEENLHFDKHLYIYINYVSHRILTAMLIIIARTAFSVR